MAWPGAGDRSYGGETVTGEFGRPGITPNVLGAMLVLLLVYVLFRGWRQGAAGVGVGAVGLVLVVWLLSSVPAQGPSPGLAQHIRGWQAVQAEAVQTSAAARQPSTVQILALGCGGKVGAGSGFVTQPGFVVTNAHVIAGFDRLRVRDTTGMHPAVAIHVDPALDIAVLSAPDVQAPAIGWTEDAATRGTEGVTLGFPGAQAQVAVRPATVQARIEAVGRDIYGQHSVRREILVLAAALEQGDSGGPFITSAGRVGGIVFAGDSEGGATGYALTAEQVRPGIAGAIARNQVVDVGACRS